MSRTLRTLGLILATIAFLVLGFVLAWFIVGEETAGTPSVAGDPTATPSAVEPTPVPPPPPTATPLPTPTPVPTPLPFVEAVPIGPLGELVASPMPDCGLKRNDEVVAGTVTLSCIEDWASVPVSATAPGRIVHVVRKPTPSEVSAIAGLPGRTDGSPATWLWAEQAQLGAHVVVDHGPLGGTSNVQTIYAGLDTIAEDVRVGLPIEAGHQLGDVGGPAASMRFGVWVDNVRQDGVVVVADGPGVETQRDVAAALGQVIGSPTDPNCPLVLGFGQLPGAARAYRNGTHQGIDFGCGAADRSAFSIADGTVVYLVDDYVDPSVPEREMLLSQAGRAGFTPHWTLVMLYGNVVIVDHGVIPGAGRVVTISAHLEEVDPAISLGATVTQGQRLGELGNRGTNASAQGIRGAADPTLHLHWELFVDNWYLGSGLDGVTVSELVTAALCQAAATPGCPA